MFTSRRTHLRRMAEGFEQLCRDYRTPGDQDFFRNRFAPTLAEVHANIIGETVRTVAELDPLKASFETLPPYLRAALGSQIVRSMAAMDGRPQGEHLKQYFMEIIAASAEQGVQRTAAEFTGPEDAERARILDIALRGLLDYQRDRAGAFSAFSRAQLTYLRGFIGFKVHTDLDGFRNALGTALSMMRTVDPDEIDHPDRRALIADGKAKLLAEWGDTLALVNR